MPTYYMDYVNGNDSADGSTFSTAGLPTVGPWKTMTNGATAARIAPGDVIRIAKSPAPYSIGNATWTNLSKTVTLDTAQTATIENCETHTAWTKNPTGDITLSTIGVGDTAKQGSACVKFLLDSSPQLSKMQAYYDLYSHDSTVHDLHAYQKISFWIYNSSAILANRWAITLCTDISGLVVDKTYKIPPIPSTTQWVPLTLTSEQGGNISASIKSIAISTGSAASSPSSYIYLDNIIACTANGLSLQSLISKNSAEQGGSEGWYGVQSIDGTNILLDNYTNTKANGGRGYWGTTGYITTYARETIKTSMAAVSGIAANTVTDSGSLALGNIEFQGGYDVVTGNQTGETFFDGLNGYGYGISISSINYITLNYFNLIRYYDGIYYINSSNITIINASNINNNTDRGIYLSNGNNNTIENISNINNNSEGLYLLNSNNSIITNIDNANNNTGNYGIILSNNNNNTIKNIKNINNNKSYGIYFGNSNNNTIITIENINNNTGYGIYFINSNNNIIENIATTGNGIYSIAAYGGGWNYITNAIVSEITKVYCDTSYGEQRVYINNLSGLSYIGAVWGSIIGQPATAGGTGKEWVLNITNSFRNSLYPLKLKIAEFAVVSGIQTTITCYFKKSHATDIAGKLVIPAQYGAQLTDIETVCPNDTNRNNLSVQFTPSVTGVYRVEAWAYWLANAADENVIVDDISITQA